MLCSGAVSCSLLILLAAAFAAGQETGDLRLVEGAAHYEEMLEIYFPDEGWGPICYINIYTFSLLEADTACRQLGYLRATSVSRSHEIIANPLLCGVTCHLHTDHLYDNCTHIRDCPSSCNVVSISCQDVNTDPRSGDVRLIDSAGNTNISAGRVEMYYEGSWVTFCGLEFEAANFVCWLTVRGRYHRNGTVMDLGFSPGTGSDNIVIGRCYAFNYYNYNYNFTTYCDIRQAPSSCVHQDDIALECIECATPNTISIFNYVCDGIPHCDMCVDECHCGNPEKTFIESCSNKCVCSEQEFQCVESGICINGGYICNGRDDCGDNSDEDNPECLEDRRRAEENLDHFGGQRVGILVGVLVGVFLVLLGPPLLLLCLPCSPVRKLYSSSPRPSHHDSDTADTISPVSSESTH